MNSPERMDIRDAVESSQPLRKTNSNARLDGAPKENIEQSWERKEAEKREQEFNEARLRKFEAIGKLVSYLTDKIAEFVNIDY